ncbi:unnamed protein product, partial [Closterium sp. NIES-54]
SHCVFDSLGNGFHYSHTANFSDANVRATCPSCACPLCACPSLPSRARAPPSPPVRCNRAWWRWRDGRIWSPSSPLTCAGERERERERGGPCAECIPQGWQDMVTIVSSDMR